MRIPPAFACALMALACSAARTGKEMWRDPSQTEGGKLRARARGMLGIEDRYRGCSVEAVFLPVGIARLQERLPEGFSASAAKEIGWGMWAGSGILGVARFECRESELEGEAVGFEVAAILVEKPPGRVRVYDPGAVDLYEVARFTLGKRHRQVLQALGYRLAEKTTGLSFMMALRNQVGLGSLHVRIWHRAGKRMVYTLLHVGASRWETGPVERCSVREGSVVQEIGGIGSCVGGMGQVSRGVNLSVLIGLWGD